MRNQMESEIIRGCVTIACSGLRIGLGGILYCTHIKGDIGDVGNDQISRLLQHHS